MTSTPTFRFRNDGLMRKKLWVPVAMAHPAKGHIAMWQECIERYSKPGDTVLDPMAGIGTTLIAALMGRNVVCVELEAHFVEPMRRSWEKMRTMPMLTGVPMGEATIIQGDARKLGEVLADCVITSPPFVEQNIRAVGDEPYGGQRTGGMARQIKNTNPYTRPVDAIVTSPPYEHQIHPNSDSPESIEAIPWTDPKKVGKSPHSQFRGITGYTRPVDAIVTSPPYEGTRSDGSGLANGIALEGGFHPYTNDGAPTLWHTQRDQTNIGNLRNTAYWDAMRQVYAECYRVLRPGGLMALVLKGFTRDHVYQDLPGQTEAMLLEAGWLKHDEWRRELWSLSFWRILQKRRDPAAFDNRLMYETVLAFRKPEGEGEGVIQTVITSPPYEGSEVSAGNVGNRIKAERWGTGHSLAPDRGYTR